MKIRKLNSIVLVLCLLLPLVGTSISAMGESVVDTKPVETISEAIGFKPIIVPFEEPKMQYPVENGGKFTMFIGFSSIAAKYYTDLSESPTIKQWIRDTGIEVEFVHPPAGQEKDTFTLLASSNSLPDAIVNGNSYYPGGDMAAVTDGVFMDLTGLIPTYMPDYNYFLENNELVRKMATTSEGGNYSIYNYKDVQAPFYQRPQLRADWLEEFGLDIPYTFSDWEVYFEKVLAEKPGVAPFTLTKNGLEGTFLGAFEAGSEAVGRYFVKEGQIHYMFNEPGLRDYLTLMNEWYTKGYISKDFASTDVSREQALTNGTVAGAVANTDGVFTLAKELGVKTATAPYPRVNKGDPYHLDIFYFPQNGTPTNISANSKNAEAALQFLNYGFTRQGSGVANFGETDVTWYMGDDGVPKFSEYTLTQTEIPLSDVEYVLRLHVIWSKYRYGDDISMIRNVKDTETWDYRAKWGIGDDPTCDNAYALPTLAFTPEAATEMGKIKTNIDTYAEEMVLRFITGSAPLSEFDAFVEQCNALGMQRLIEIYQEAYEAFLAK